VAKLVSLFALLLLSLAGLAVATQTVAAALHYAPALGPPWIRLGATSVYAPWAWVTWSSRFERYAPDAFRTASAETTAASVLGCLVAALLGATRRRRKVSTTHGSSRWATTAEMRGAGLLQSAGVVLGQTDDARYSTRLDGGTRRIALRRAGTLLRHDGPEHVMCFAPTRSGKGVGLVVPTLLSWPASVLVYDIKKENWALTAGWRRQFSRVWRFEPTATDSLRFNPLLEIRRGLSEVKDTQNVADILVDPTGEKETRDHWQTTAHTLLTGAILHVLYAEEDKTLAGVAAFLSDPSRRQFETLQRMLSTPHLPTGPHPALAQAGREMLNKSDNELSGVMSTALACLGLYRDPVVARATSSSDFRIADLMNADAPVSLYLVVPPSDLARTRPIIRLVLNQIGRRLTESMEFGDKKAYRHRLLLLLDEFPSLGRLDFFETALAFLAGYGLKAMLIAQSLNQLEKTYGQYNSILDNCHVRLTYAANDDKTARRISDLLGQATITRTQKSFSGSGFFLSHRSESEQELGRPLLTPAEVTQLPEDDGILLVGGQLPYRVRKVRYFLDRRFRGRDKLRPPNSAEEQVHELLPPTPSEWQGTVAAPPPVATTDAMTAASTAGISVARSGFESESSEVLVASRSPAAAAEPTRAAVADPSPAEGWTEVLASARQTEADDDATDNGSQGDEGLPL
jgi:type IV secretion system protein VirD4